MTTNSEEWKEQFKAVYQRAEDAYRSGRHSPSTMFDADDQAFLRQIGATDQEIFDYVEDSIDYGGDPTFEDVLEVTAIRYQYFCERMDRTFPEEFIAEQSLPRKGDSVAGISWLPRIIEKAKAKLRGELPPELMYGCGGDRPFLRKAGIRLPEFLAFVRDAEGDDNQVVEFYRSRLSEGGKSDSLFSRLFS